MSEGSVVIPTFVVIPLAGAFVSALLGKRVRGLPGLVAILATLLLLVLSLWAVIIKHSLQQCAGVTVFYTTSTDSQYFEHYLLLFSVQYLKLRLNQLVMG